MKILVVSQYFWPESFLINNVAVGLVERGHQVTVLTGSPNYPKGRFFEGYGFFNAPEEYQGVYVVRVPLIPRGRGAGVQLALNYLSFAASASIAGPLLCRGKFDQIFVFEPSPITVGIPALVMKSLKSASVLFWVQDLWPESLSATGALSSKVVLGWVGKLVRAIYRRCDRILIQSRSFAGSVIQQGGSPERIRYFPNSAEKVFTCQSASEAEIPALPTGFRIMFAGNIGAAQDFGNIIATAKLLKEYRDIRWIIVGDGRMRQWAETEIARQGLGEIFSFLGRYPLEAMPAFFAQADALLVTLRKEKIFAMTIPTKIQAYLACGRPVIAAIDGEGAKIIEEAGAGFTCPAEDPGLFAQAVLKMYRTSSVERERMAASGRKYYQLNFDSEALLDKLVLWMQELTDAKNCHTHER
ncbi:glycosyltransferase family 4 protein [Geobacter sp. DSM 9736]|uniref:glycosyltransferase family 4 protein n=1 Tax=Geobacter sp. DSM 9736 TaxID=1277350 RepID=UPI000B512506|nr:glycosyltransferase family 4 protein [Geobacter sp. DSM 9736]SNB45065.1 Glycosyltransferase involved in cell wall bisynthesis [Geobacter sp. DSM 9736]